ncbi:hypothetical protein CHS0354_012196 [Potamilus streckersoni]|uniref:WW domain binding protein VOPP1 n=1 Tax=Potamilus streckersoni TaxID=2493646 RepID=A0AAE0SAG7_9BIVA|nr:hypothetical protein CHS0354_012196 [Potamilus streckersoni]
MISLLRTMDSWTTSVLLVIIPNLVEAKYCTYTSNYGKAIHFYCRAFEDCCSDKCCENFLEFYKLWYFWFCVVILLVSIAVLIYWLRKRNHLQHHASRRRCHRRCRNYSPLEGDQERANETVIPSNVIFTPPSYGGDNKGVPHPGPPPYTFGSASSMDSRTLPRSPPPYNQVDKEPPPSYDAVFTMSHIDQNKKIPADLEQINSEDAEMNSRLQVHSDTRGTSCHGDS